MIEQRMNFSDRKVKKLPSANKENPPVVCNAKPDVKGYKKTVQTTTQRHCFGDSFSSVHSREEDRSGNVRTISNQVSNSYAVKNSSKVVDLSKKPQNYHTSDYNHVKKRGETGKIREKEFSRIAKKSNELKQNKTQSKTSPLRVEDKPKPVLSSKEATLEESPTKPVELKRKKPSEIPLRKNRTDGSRDPKAVSTLLQKPINEVESFTYFDFYLNKKPFSPIDEISICSDLQITINPISSSEKLNSEREPISQGPSIESVFDIQLKNCDDNPHVPTNLEELFIQLSDEKSSTGKTVKILDMDKVKASSFTVLQTSSVVLDRLESLHKQNVLTKEQKGEASCKKKKPCTPKQYFNPIRRRSSAKSLFSHKKTKSSSKVKLKKSRKEIGEDQSPKKFTQPKINSGQVSVFKNSLPAKKINSEDAEENCTKKAKQVTSEIPELSKEVDTSISRPKQKPRNKLSLQKAKKIESKIPTSQKHSKPVEDVEKIKASPTKSKADGVTTLRSKDAAGFPQVVTKKVDNKLRNDDESSDKTVILTERKPTAQKGNELEKRKAKKVERHLKEFDLPKVKNFPLIVKGTALKLGKNDALVKKKESKTKVKLKIDLNLQQASEESTKDTQSSDMMVKNDEKKQNENLKKEKSKIVRITERIQEPKTTETLPSKPDLSSQEISKSCSLLKQKFLNKVSSLKAKDVRNSIRSDAGDRPAHSFSSIFPPNIPPLSKPKPETKVRTGLTKSIAKDEKREIFEENSLKLRRRSSEPISLSGYILKRTDFSTCKPSVSSVTSSLRHLNTDDIEDFFFWEPVPQKMTSCWEMTLYQYKKPWSVISCSVLRDNWLSNTSSLILENVRNGRSYSTRPTGVMQTGRVPCVKKNSFDVEPSITQKNIDIINWLSALNFPTSTSNTAEVMTESSCTSESGVDTQNFNKAQVTQKRRKLLKNLKILEKASQLLTEDASVRTYIIQDVEIEENLQKSRDLIEYLDSKYNRQNIPVKALFISRSSEKKTLLDDQNISESKRTRNYEFETMKSRRIDGSISSNMSEQFTETTPNKSPTFGRFWARKENFLSSKLNFWEYFFIFFVFLVIVVYFSKATSNSGFVYA